MPARITWYHVSHRANCQASATSRGRARAYVSHFRFRRWLGHAIWIVTIVKVKGREDRRRSRRKGRPTAPWKRATRSRFRPRFVQPRPIDLSARRHIETLFITLALTKHGLLKKMTGVQKDTISPRRGDGGDRSYEASHQIGFNRFTDGCKDETCADPCRGGCY